MIRWNEPEGQGGDIQLASLDTSVLHYDGQGQLIVPVHPEPVAEETREGAEAAADVSYSTKGVAAPRDVLPSIRLIATRYQDHPALARLDLTPAEWSAFFQAMIKVESNYSQGAVSHAGALGLAQLMPGTADYRKRRPRPIDFALARWGEWRERRSVGSSSGTTRRGPYAPRPCWA